MTAPKISPQQAALTRIELLRTRAATAHHQASALLDKALTDAVRFDGLADTPAILTEESIVELTQLKNVLSEMVVYYDEQKENFTSVLRNAASQTGAVRENLQEAVAKLRERTERLARGEAAETVVEKPKGPASYQPVMPAREAARAAVSVAQDSGWQPEEAKKPAATVPETPVTAPKAPEVTPVVPSVLPSAENGLQRLISADSPLLDLFAPSPWVPEGKGVVTIGTEGFQWYKRTDPMERDARERASLPSGFYMGDTRPKCVVVRMQTCILVWSLEMTLESMQVFMVGVSDANPEDLRWFNVTEMSSTLVRCLINELSETAKKYKASK